MGLIISDMLPHTMATSSRRIGYNPYLIPPPPV